MNRCWIKLCGTTNYEDALLAWESGADAIGFIFVQGSRRCVTGEQARAIIEQLARPIERIGITQNASIEEALALATSCGLSGLQLHGEEAPEYVSRLRERLPQARLIKVVHVPSSNALRPTLERQIAKYQGCGADNLLLDSAYAGASGGTGRRFDVVMAANALRNAGNKLPFIIAGGLTPEGVDDAIALLLPFGVDVASGIEHQPGKKDPDKLRAFIQAARAVNTGKVQIA